MHVEETLDDSSFLTKKQLKLLLKVLMNLMAYFGLYFLSVQMDLHLKTSDEFYKIQIAPAAIGLETAFIMRMYLNYKTRKEI